MKTRQYTRVDTIRKYVDAMLLRNKDDRDRRCGYVHLYGVGVLAALIAMKRGHDKKYAELAEIAGILHDYVSYKRPDTPEHAHVCAPVIRGILEETGEFSSVEIDMITAAVYNHSDKSRRDSEFDEILKDADVMHHWLRNSMEDFNYCEPRTAELIAEFGLTV
jgi:HD superfamily phosphodiesterase